MLHHTIQNPKQQINSSKIVFTRKRAGPLSRSVNVKCKSEVKSSTLTTASITKGADYMGKFQPGRQGWKKSRLHEIFQLGQKLKSEVNLDMNSSEAFVVLAISIFPHLSIIISARAETFSCDYMGFFNQFGSLFE